MVGRCYVTGGGMEMQSVWKDCSKFDGLLVLIPPCGVQLPQLTCNPCNFSAIRWPLRLDCLESAIPPQSPGLQKTVPALPGFWADILGGLRSGCDLGQPWTNLLHLVAIRLERVRIALYLQSTNNPRIDPQSTGLW